MDQLASYPLIRPFRSLVLLGTLSAILSPKPALAQIAPVEKKRILPSEHLEKIWKNQPEWLAMFLDILAGGQVNVTDGWYRRSDSKTRFDFPSTLKKYDRNGDGSISRSEFGGTDIDFQRLDRDHDGKLTQEDFEFRRNELERARSKMIMSFADRDRDGKLSNAEFQEALFMAVRDNFTRHLYFADSINHLKKQYEASEKEGLPFISLADLQEVVDRNGVKFGLPAPPHRDAEYDLASRETLLMAFARRDLGSYLSGPDLNQPAPDFTLEDAKTDKPVTLSKHLGNKPIVLIFGCLSSPYFRAEAGNLLKLEHRYGERAEIWFIYVRESHTVDGWRLKQNDEAKLKMSQPVVYKDRKAVANYSKAKLGLTMRAMADTLDDHVTSLYSGSPSRLYLIDRDGKVAYKGGRGPFGFKPSELEQALLLLLQADSTNAPPGK